MLSTCDADIGYSKFLIWTIRMKITVNTALQNKVLSLLYRSSALFQMLVFLTNRAAASTRVLE